MILKILGCGGGIQKGSATTAFLLDDDVLIDAGTGVANLSIDEMSKVRHVFLTHSHLDHIAGLPLMIDSVFDRVNEPIVVYGLAETIKALTDHIFNWCIWPDFSQLPTIEQPVLTYRIIRPGEVVQLGQREIRPIEVNHTVPAVAYSVTAPSGVFAFSGDTYANESLWRALNEHDRLDLLILDSAFDNGRGELAADSRHYCPEVLAEDLRQLRRHSPEVCISHLKPGLEDRIIQQLKQAVPHLSFHRLSDGDTLYV